MALANVEPSGTQLSGGLTLITHEQVLVTFKRKVPGSNRIHVDEWELKETFNRLLRQKAKVRLPDDSLTVKRGPKEGDGVATAVLNIWDGSRQAEDIKGKMDKVDLMVSGIRLQCLVNVEEHQGFEAMEQEWKEKNDGYAKRKPNARPDTLILEGLPSRWFANAAVSSTTASPLVVHEIFSHFGPIRQLDVVSGEADMRKAVSMADKDAMSSSLECKLVLQYETHEGFLTALKALWNHVMVKAGSKKPALVRVSWDREGYFTEGAIRRRRFEKEQAERAEQRRLAEERRRQEQEARRLEMERLAEERRLTEEQLEKERQEAEERERLEREEEERQEREKELARLEAERLAREEEEERLREELRQQEEERARLEEERKQRAEEERIQQELREAKEAARRAAEKERARSKRRAEEEDLRKRDTEKRLRTQLLERQQDRPRPHRRHGADEKSEEEEAERWQLEETHTTASLQLLHDLSKGVRNSDAGVLEGLESLSSRRLRSVIVS